MLGLLELSVYWYISAVLLLATRPLQRHGLCGLRHGCSAVCQEFTAGLQVTLNTFRFSWCNDTCIFVSSSRSDSEDDQIALWTYAPSCCNVMMLFSCFVTVAFGLALEVYISDTIWDWRKILLQEHKWHVLKAQGRVLPTEVGQDCKNSRLHLQIEILWKTYSKLRHSVSGYE